METGQEQAVNVDTSGARSYSDLEAELGLTPSTPSKPEPQDGQPEGDPKEPQPEPQQSEVVKDVEPKVEPKEEPEPSGEESTKGEDKAIFDINVINEKFSTNLKDEDELKSLIEKADGLSALEDKVKDYDSLQEKLNALEKEADPMKYFKDENDFKAQMFKLQYPDKDPGVATRLFQADLSEVADRELIAYNLMLDNPDLDGGLKGALDMVDDKFGIVEGEDVDTITRNKMKVEANAAKRQIDQMKSEINIPEKVDSETLAKKQSELQEQQRDQLSKGWGDIAKEASKSLDDIVVTDTVDGKEQEVFRYSLAKDFPETEVESVVNRMVESGIDINKDNTAAMMQVMRERAIANNLDKITKAIREDAVARAEEKRMDKQHNPGKPTSEPPKQTDKNLEGQERLKSQLGKTSGWWLNK